MTTMGREIPKIRARFTLDEVSSSPPFTSRLELVTAMFPTVPMASLSFNELYCAVAFALLEEEVVLTLLSIITEPDLSPVTVITSILIDPMASATSSKTA
jgi:hypothetical protein